MIKLKINYNYKDDLIIKNYKIFNLFFKKMKNCFMDFLKNIHLNFFFLNFYLYLT